MVLDNSVERAIPVENAPHLCHDNVHCCAASTQTLRCSNQTHFRQSFLCSFACLPGTCTCVDTAVAYTTAAETNKTPLTPNPNPAITNTLPPHPPPGAPPLRPLYPAVACLVQVNRVATFVVVLVTSQHQIHAILVEQGLQSSQHLVPQVACPRALRQQGFP